MKRNMYDWVKGVIASPVKKAIPVLSFPCVSLLGRTVNELIHDPALQAEGMLKVAQRIDSGASVSFMDLSVEAEAFGCTIACSEGEVPTVTNAVIGDIEDADPLRVPALSQGRPELYIEAIRSVSSALTDRPVFAGCIGPYSLAGRLMGMTELMINCYEEEDAVHAVLAKCSEFIEKYILAFKEAGANGVVIAEPAAGLISPALMAEFSGKYVRDIISRVQDESFIVIYHNCGNAVNKMAKEIASLGAMGYHFGNAVSMAEMLPQMPRDALVMGNVDPAGTLRNGTPDKVREETLRVMSECCSYDNFVISSGCDVPPATPWENIDAFFAAVNEFYGR